MTPDGHDKTPRETYYTAEKRRLMLIPLLILIGVLLAWAFAEPYPDSSSVTSGGKMNENVQNRTEQQWKAKLTAEQFRVCRQKGTERPFTGEYWNTKSPGTYVCAACGQKLFDSTSKFDSGSGWPSFTQPIADTHVQTHLDTSHFMVRTEVTCSHCGSHLGHVFDDSPPPERQRYCINSVSLRLIPEELADSGAGE